MLQNPVCVYGGTYLLTNRLREGLKKKEIVENSTRGGAAPDFPLRKKKNIGLKHWILPKDHFKTHLFFSIFGWGTLLRLDLGPTGVSNL